MTTYVKQQHFEQHGNSMAIYIKILLQYLEADRKASRMAEIVEMSDQALAPTVTVHGTFRTPLSYAN